MRYRGFFAIFWPMRLLAFLLMLPGLAFGQGLHELRNGDVADAKKINENFELLNTAATNQWGLQKLYNGSTYLGRIIPQSVMDHLVVNDSGWFAFISLYDKRIRYPCCGVPARYTEASDCYGPAFIAELSLYVPPRQYINAKGWLYSPWLYPVNPEVPWGESGEVYVVFDDPLRRSELPATLYRRDYNGACVQEEPDPDYYDTFFQERLNDPSITGFTNGVYNDLKIDIGL